MSMSLQGVSMLSQQRTAQQTATLLGSVQLVQLSEVRATCCLRGGLMFVVRQHKLSGGGMA
eukprot:21522-Heterococcus_DN1.PRE.1